VNRPLEIQDLGLRDYAEIWQLQKELVEKRARQEIPDQLLLVEHPAVFTCGRRLRAETLQDLPAFPLYEIERGGELSFHEPGQLVGYPIIWLPPEKRDLRAFLSRLEKTLILTLKDLDFQAHSHPEAGHTGVWLKDRKIASIGIAVRRWVTWHGFALNINNSLTMIQGLNPCGFPAEVMISLKEAGQREYNMEYIKERVKIHFQELLATS